MHLMAQRRSLLTYIRLKIIVSILRLPLALAPLYPGWNRLGFVPKSESVKPTYNTYVPSTTSTRKIKILVHEPKAVSKDSLLPVHINFHGSAFILPCLDCDAELCHHISNTLGCIVIDGDYAKAPEHPFPAGLEDVLDVINWVASQPDRFDVNRITVGGQSAGGALALSASAILPNGVVKGAALFYPGTDFSRSGLPDDQRMYKPYIRGKTPGIGLGRTVRNFYKQCYVLPGADPRNPRMSPLFADPSAFPPVFLTVSHSHFTTSK